MEYVRNLHLHIWNINFQEFRYQHIHKNCEALRHKTCIIVITIYYYYVHIVTLLLLTQVFQNHIQHLQTSLPLPIRKNIILKISMQERISNNTRLLHYECNSQLLYLSKGSKGCFPVG